MRVLGIETSCDETGVAIYDEARGLLANQLYSQVKLHADYGGVVPELASRDHVRKTVPLIQAAMAEARLKAQQIDAVAYTSGPGLLGALLVGATIGRALACAWNVYSQGGAKFPTGGKSAQAESPRALQTSALKVSRSGVIPGPTVKVRMGEGNVSCQARCACHGYCFVVYATPETALILVTYN